MCVRARARACVIFEYNLGNNMFLANVFKSNDRMNTWSTFLHTVTSAFIHHTPTDSCLHSFHIVNKTDGNINKR